jgi:hypothetical protein
MDRTALFHQQTAVVFTETKSLEQLMVEVGQIRCLPLDGTNISTVFGQPVLGKLQLTEEQLDWTLVLRTFTPAELRLAEKSDSPLESLQIQLRDRTEREQLSSNKIQASLNKAKIELPTTVQRKSAIHITLLEKHAAEIPQSFTSHCKSLQQSLSSIHVSQKGLIQQLLDFPRKVDRRLSLDKLEALFFNLTLEVQSELTTTQSLVQLIGDLSDQPSTETEAFDLHARQTENSVTVKELFQSKFGFATTSKNSIQFLQANLRPELFPVIPLQTLMSDALVLKYLFGLLNKDENRVFPAAFYYRLTEVSTGQLLGTLPELLIQPMLSQLCNGLCSVIYCLSMAIVYLLKFGKPANESAFSSALLICVQHYLTLTRISELLGLQSNHLYKDYLTVLATLIPNFLDQPQAGLDGLLKLDSPSSGAQDPPAYEKLWSYTYTCKPWMPDSYTVYSTRDVVGFDLVKADRIMNMIEHGDSRMLWRWCGLDLPLSETTDVDTLISKSFLLQSLLEEASQHPDHLITRKLMASLLFQTAEVNPRFYTSSTHRRFVERVLKEEIQETPNTVDDEEVSGWDSLDLEISEG